VNRHYAGAIGAAILLSALVLSGTRSMAADPRMADLVQAGKIRLAVFLPQYNKDPASGEIRPVGTGFVGAELTRALAARLGIAMQIIGYPTPTKAVEGLKARECDLTLMGIEPSRVGELDFTPPVVQFDYTFLVPAGSTIRSAVDADRPGIRIAVVRNHASTLTLSRIVKHAELIGADLPDAAFELLRGGKADVFAAPREPLMDYAATLPGARLPRRVRRRGQGVGPSPRRDRARRPADIPGGAARRRENAITWGKRRPAARIGLAKVPAKGHPAALR